MLDRIRRIIRSILLSCRNPGFLFPISAPIGDALPRLVTPHSRAETPMIGPPGGGCPGALRAPSASICVHLRFIPSLAPGGGLPPISETLLGLADFD